MVRAIILKDISDKKISKKGFQVDADWMTQSTNQIDARRKSVNQRLNSKHQFGNSPKLEVSSGYKLSLI